MGMPELSRTWTRDMVVALPADGNRYELLDGELLVTPAPSARHQDAVAAVFRRLDPYVRANGIGHIGLAPADLTLEGGQVAQPDVYVVPLHEGRAPRRWEDYGIPLLVAEILSLGTARGDRLVKWRRYQRTGVTEYWVVDLDARVVERWRPGDARPEIVDETLTWQPDPSHAPLILPLAELFADVPDLG